MTTMQGLTLPGNMRSELTGRLASFAARQREQADKLRAQHGIEAQSWYRITAAADPDEAEVMLYDEIGGWFGATADQFIADLRGITSPNLRVRINSPGGSVFEGIAIANALRSHPGNVIVQVDSVAASIASVIAMAGDRVEMAPNSMLMIHDASGLCMGNAGDMDEMAQLLALISDNIADAYAARAGGTREEWRERMRAESWYLAEDAVAAGLADEALAVPKKGEPVEPQPGMDEPDMARAWDLAAYGYAGPPQPEHPEPGPPPAQEEPQQVVLTATLGDSLGEDIVAMVRRAVAKDQATPSEETVPAPQEPAEPEAPAEPEPEAPADTDDWTADLAHLTTGPADDWSADLSHLVDPDSSSSAATSA